MNSPPYVELWHLSQPSAGEGGARVTEVERMEMKQLFEEGVSISELARKFGHYRKTIRQAINREAESRKGVP